MESLSTIEPHQLKIVIILTVGFAFASILGYLSQRAKLSPLLGYLLAGYLIGPYSPGFVADLEISEQLAEIGVILMMFGVGLHFRWEDLNRVRDIAIPGAIGQTVVAAVVSTLLVYNLGWSLESGIIIGLGIGVASTVVLVRGLASQNLLKTSEGFIAMGWLIVEDIFTVIALILLPTLHAFMQGLDVSFFSIGTSVFFALFKFTLLVAFMFTFGRHVVTYILLKIAQTHSHELFTLTLLALNFAVATGSALLFGTSIALGAFIAGMVVGQTEVKHQATANSLPMKDAFVVVFFLSVGMLFNPAVIQNYFPLFIGLLAIILILKPLVAFLIVLLLRYPFRTAMIVAVSLAQIGEFSFILTEEAMKLKLIPEDAFDVIVACAFVSISINPLFFRWADRNHNKKPVQEIDQKSSALESDNTKKALLIGKGAIAKNVIQVLESFQFTPHLYEGHESDLSFDDETTLNEGNTVNIEAIESSDLLVVINQNIASTLRLVEEVKESNPKLLIIAIVSSFSDLHQLQHLNIHSICTEEESLIAFSELLKKLKDKLLVS